MLASFSKWKRPSTKRSFPALRGREFVPKSPMSQGAKFFSYRRTTQYASAKIIADMADDLPSVNVKPHRNRVACIRSVIPSATHFRSVACGLCGSLDSTLAAAARLGMEQKIDALLQVGDAAYSMLGLLNQTSTNTYVVPNGALGSPLWTQKTSDEILLDLNGIAKAAHIATRSADMSTKCCFRSIPMN